MAQLLQAAHDMGAVVDAAIDELVGLLQGMAVVAEDLRVLGQHGFAHGFQRLLPGFVAAGFGKALVDAGFAGFLVLQQLVGHAAVSGNDKNALIDPVLRVFGQENIVQYFRKAAHGSAADFFYAVHERRPAGDGIRLRAFCTRPVIMIYAVMMCKCGLFHALTLR